MDELAGMLTALAGGVGRSARTRYASQIPSFEEWLMEQGYTGGGLDPDTLSFLKRAYESYVARETESAQAGARQEEAARNNNMKSRTTEGPKSEKPTGTFQDRQRAWGDARKKSWEKSAEIFYGDAKPQMASGGGGGAFPAIDGGDGKRRFGPGNGSGSGSGNGSGGGKTNQESPGSPWSAEESRGFQDSLRGLGRTNASGQPAGSPPFGLTQTPGAGGAGPGGGGAGGATTEELMEMVKSLLGGNPERSSFRPYNLRGGW